MANRLSRGPRSTGLPLEGGTLTGPLILPNGDRRLAWNSGTTGFNLAADGAGFNYAGNVFGGWTLTGFALGPYPILWSPTGQPVVQQSGILNYSTTQQSIAAATRTYLTGSLITVPTFAWATKLRIGTIMRWKWQMAKTAAGSAASTIDVAIGTNGTTADAAVLSFTKPAGTAVADQAWCALDVILRGPLSAAGIFVGTFRLTHNLAATGHATIPNVVVNTISGAFDVTTVGLKAGVCLTTGASDVITVEQVEAEALNL